MPFHLYDNSLCLSSSCFKNDGSSSAKSQDHTETGFPVLSAQGRRLNKEAWNTESDLDPVHHFRDELWSVLALTNAAVA